MQAKGSYKVLRRDCVVCRRSFFFFVSRLLGCFPCSGLKASKSSDQDKFNQKVGSLRASLICHGHGGATKVQWVLTIGLLLVATTGFGDLAYNAISGAVIRIRAGGAIMKNLAGTAIALLIFGSGLPIIASLLSKNADLLELTTEASRLMTMLPALPQTKKLSYMDKVIRLLLLYPLVWYFGEFCFQMAFKEPLYQVANLAVLSPGISFAVALFAVLVDPALQALDGLIQVANVRRDSSLESLFSSRESSMAGMDINNLWAIFARTQAYYHRVQKAMSNVIAFDVVVLAIVTFAEAYYNVSFFMDVQRPEDVLNNLPYVWQVSGTYIILFYSSTLLFILGEIGARMERKHKKLRQVLLEQHGPSCELVEWISATPLEFTCFQCFKINRMSFFTLVNTMVTYLVILVELHSSETGK